MTLTATTGIIWVTVLATFACWRSARLAEALWFWPPAVTIRHQRYRFLTYAVVHTDVWHLVFNMFAFWSFGQVCESVLAAAQLPGGAGLWLLLLYVSAAVISIVPSYRKHRDDSEFVSLGASGAVSAIVGFVVACAPTMKVLFYFVPMPGWLFLGIFLAGSAWFAANPRSRLNHSAHITGTLYGVIAGLIVWWAFVPVDLRVV